MCDLGEGECENDVREVEHERDNKVSIGLGERKKIYVTTLITPPLKLPYYNKSTTLSLITSPISFHIKLYFSFA